MCTTARNADDKYEYGYADGASNTMALGGNAWIIESMTQRKVNIAGYHNEGTLSEGISIGSGVTATDLPTGETILLRANESTILGENGNTLFSVPQLRENGVEVDNKARWHGGAAAIIVDDYVIPMTMVNSMMTIKIRRPTKHERFKCPLIELTSDIPWHPEEYTEPELSSKDYNELVDQFEEW